MSDLRHDVQEALETALKTMERLEFQRRLGMMDGADCDDKVAMMVFDTQRALEQALAVYARALRSSQAV